ncbi:DNA-directed RNA polymerase subunit omega [Fictibacillus arsenicus]|jgi:DNA-directed RNA polymerase subunit omega|uniref:DNA-directed RNA polymerase subunit omega n=1 Tax=Fictibacillus arsenicus TaxID=255247 RepID=A0A1B1Z457_9BACL|nr:DNA-directed RNA polymerase subunit omega [Fictibacillus arsenicus]ANX12228.1 DNA-directed RNA polymerase subunit omega [Fictibacillus arsenicus]
MLYPSIDSLMEKIDSKYSLVTLSSKRAREIQKYGNQQIAKPVSYKFVGKALEEIQSGILTKVGETPAD